MHPGKYAILFLFGLVWLGWRYHLATPPKPPAEAELNAGIRTDNSYSVDELVRNIFVKGSCDNVSNISAIGHPGGIGYFENGADVIGLDKGIILSTGPIRNAEGPNEVTDESGNFHDNSGDVDLNILATNDIRDAVGIEFDFVPLDSIVTFRYVFASEEYCEFVGSIYNDVFGFFISGPGIFGSFSNGSRNVALIPGTDDYVAINSVNHLSNTSYYIRNETDADAAECGISHSDWPGSNSIEYDGFTQTLTAVLRLIPCKTYHIRLVVADVGDNFYDSAVFLEAESFNIGGSVKLSAANQEGVGQNEIYEGCSDGYFLFERTEGSVFSYPLTVNFQLSAQSTAEEGLDYEPIPGNIIIPAGQPSATIPIQVINDHMPEPPETLILELDIPCACYSDTAQLVIYDSPFMSIDLPDQSICENGTLALSPHIQGGTPGYTYEWSNQEVGPRITVPATGPLTYSVTVTDRCGNFDVDTARLQIVDPPEAFLSGYAEICEGDTAFLDVEFTGVPPWTLEYQIDGWRQPVIEDIRDSLYRLPAFRGGQYEILRFTDAACEGIAEGIAQIDLMSIELETLTEGVSCYGASDGAMTVQVGGGTPPYFLSWNQGLAGNLQHEELQAGGYVLTVTDSRGCKKVTRLDIPTPDQLQEIVVDCEKIQNGPGGLTARGGTPPYNYSVDGSNFQGQSIFEELNGGQQYALTIQDAHGCRLEQEFVMPAFYDEMAELPPEIELSLGERSQLQPQLNIPESLIANVRWVPDENLNCADCLYPELTALQDGVFTLRIIDRFGCRDEASVLVRVNPAIDVYLPTAFSPNGDRINDRFTVFTNEFQVERIILMRIFDRWGDLIFEVKDLPPNNSSLGWDGTYRGRLLANGVFVYFVELELANGSTTQLKGNVTLLR